MKSIILCILHDLVYQLRAFGVLDALIALWTIGLVVLFVALNLDYTGNITVYIH